MKIGNIAQTRNIFRVLSYAWAAALARAAPRPARAGMVAAPAVPADIEVPAGNRAFLAASAPQDYVCLRTSGRTRWCLARRTTFFHHPAEGRSRTGDAGTSGLIGSSAKAGERLVSSRTEHWRRRVGLMNGIALLLMCCLPLPAFAALAPVMGGHYAARPSDTGFMGAVNSVGAYGASVPLDLPAARAGLPVPVQIVYGGNRVGAAGLGWDVPLSTIVRSKTLAYRRPKPGTFSVVGSDPLPLPETLALTLGGAHTDLVLNPDGTAWMARQGDAQLEVRTNGDGSMVLYDGNGLVYEFSAQGGAAGSRLDNGNLFLLRSITGTGGTVHLEYAFAAPALPGGGTGLSIDLKSVSYNQSPTNSSCFKNKIQLNYGALTTAPLSMSILGGTVLARVQKLASISVDAKAACADAAVSLRRYDFTYQTDPDTHREQLRKVTMIGQQGTPERNVTLPVASYGYGSLTDSNGAITYQKTQSISLGNIAAPVFSYGLGYTSVGYRAVPNLLYTPQSFVDLNGDGRPDLVTELGAFRNQPATTRGQTRFTLPSESGLTVLGTEVSQTSGSEPRYSVWQFRSNSTDPAIALPLRNPVDKWTQYIDINGDGRMDFIDASLAADHWVVRLNTPDPADPNKSVIVDRDIPIASLHTALGIPGGSKVPLARSVTLARQGPLTCFRKAKSGLWFVPQQFGCPGLEAEVAAHAQSAQTTLTLWELRDINGDGYPDLVHDRNPIPAAVQASAPPISNDPEGTLRFLQGTGIDLSGPRNVDVLYNSAGVHLSGGSPVFESPITLDADGCGLGRWEAAPGDTSNTTLYQTCGFEEVNGDGIADRVTSVVVSGPLGLPTFVSRAALGTGNPGLPYAAGTTVTLPGALSRVDTDMVSVNGGAYVPRSCINNSFGAYDTRRSQALRDINGDGIPDYVEKVGGSTVWSVSFGTGAGFTASKALTVPAGLELAKETSSCNFDPSVIPSGSGIARTPTGLYDLDGDGQPEVVAMNFDARTLDVYQLKSPIHQFEIGGFASVPQAGRLISIDNGYGATARLSYQSAKDDTSTPHNVPYPEVVVGAELTTDSASVGVLRAATVHHAYGNAGLVFDSAQDRFVFPGYGRTATMVGTLPGSNPQGVVTLTDTYGLAPFVPGSDAAARFKRYRMTGQVSDVTTLSGDITGLDPWAFLTVNIANDPRRVGGTHYDWDARLLASGRATGQNEPCAEMMYPYDYTASLANAPSPNDECTRRGFVFQKKVYSWRGAPGTSDPATISSTVRTNSSVEAIDDFGRITEVRDDNDLAIANDDLCTRTTYANPVSATARPRILNAVATRTVTNCASTPLTLSKSTWEYDTTNGTKLPAGQVRNGFVTAHIQSRLDENGQPIPDAKGNSDVRFFDATYDATGNLRTLTRTRDDGAIRTETFAYDPFNLALTVAVTDASGGIPRLMVNIERDPVTLNPLNTGDPNGTRRGSTFDGFNRVVLSIVTPPGGTTGVLAAMSYAGFGVGETGGRRIEQKVFTDPVRPGNVATAGGRTGTMYFDPLGRPTRTEVQMGADYGGKVMVRGERFYDLLGRVEFETDPHPSDETRPYGTTWHFNGDGTPRCAIRARGKQSLTQFTNESDFMQLYPICFKHDYVNRKEIFETRDAASNLPTTPQARIIRRLTFSATGQMLADWTYKAEGANVAAKEFGYDALGHRNSLTRYLDPATLANPVTTRWHFDSFGQVVELDEPGSAPQFLGYDTWNQLTQVQWTDATTGGSIDKRTISRYDALGRLVHSEDRNNQATIPGTVRDFVYDQAFSSSTPAVTATHVIGRLAKATADTSSVFFSYDDFGQVDAQVFSDTTVSPARVYVQKNQWHGDGSPQALHLLLPDHDFADERVDYSYDSAALPRAVTYTDGTAQDLFRANGTGGIDLFGRIRQAQIGPATFNAVFAETGRRLIQDLKVTTPSQHSRRISFAPVPGTTASVTAFDPVGRERARQEFVDGMASPVKFVRYDSLGRFFKSHAMNAGIATTERSVEYNPLGNLTAQDDVSTPANNVAFTYQTPDPDRICSVGYGGNTPPTACNVSYDAVGNIVSQPTRNNGTRTFSYFPGGQVRQIIQGSSVATYDYDAFGAVQRLVLSSTTSGDTRQDKYFGGSMAIRNEAGTPVVLRTIPVPGATATRHGPTGKWTFAFGERHGTRFVTNEQGEFVQGVDYQPFGEVKNPTGALPGSPDYTREQWNGGDLLAAFGLNRLGVRLYDPVIGRFLSRDPLFDPRNDFNPYAFAANDPINNADPIGLCIGAECNGQNLPPPCDPGVCGSTGPGIPLKDVVHDIGHAIKCLFANCGPKVKPPHTSTTTSEAGNATVSVRDGASGDRRAISDRTCGGGLDIGCMSRRFANNAPGQAFQIKAGTQAALSGAGFVGSVLPDAESDSDLTSYSYTIYDYLGPVTSTANPESVAQAVVNNPSAFFPFDVDYLWGDPARVSLNQLLVLNNVRIPYDNNNWVYVSQLGRNSFTFTTLPGHFDAPGSTIRFDFIDIDGSLYLKHTAKGWATFGLNRVTGWAARNFAWKAQAERIRAKFYPDR